MFKVAPVPPPPENETGLSGKLVQLPAVVTAVTEETALPDTNTVTTGCVVQVPPRIVKPVCDPLV